MKTIVGTCQFIRSFLVSAALGFALAGCGGGGGGGSAGGTTTTATAKGVVYPVVAGLTYSTNSGTGVVAADGSYSYKNNESVTFSAGGIELNTVPAAANVTPLPLENDVASTNLLRLLKALDTDHDLSNGITLPTLPASSSTVDLTSEVSVAAALASLSSTATLPIASDAQVATALASAKTTALQNMGTYGTTYNAIIQTTVVGTPQTYYPKDATVSLTSQPDWSTGTMSGTATLTLNDNSKVTFTFNSAAGTYTAQGITVTYEFQKDYGAKSRIIHLLYGSCGSGKCGYLVLRDNSQPNMPPVARVNHDGTTVAIALSMGGFDTYTWCTGWSGSGPGSISDGSKDFDGFITSVTLTSNKGKTVLMNLNVPTVGPACVSEIYYSGETPGVTVTVTDDEGATTTKTIGSSSPGSGAGSTLVLSAPFQAGGPTSYSFIGGGDGGTMSLSSVLTLDGTTANGIYTAYSRIWTTYTSTPNPNGYALEINYYEDANGGGDYLELLGYGFDSTGSLVAFNTSLQGTGFNGANACRIGGSCTTAGITLNRAAGTITLNNVAVTSFNTAVLAPSVLLNGTFTFNPF